MNAMINNYMVLHVDLFVESMTQSLEFYCAKLGFSVVDDTVLEGPLVRSISAGLCDSARVVLIRPSRVGPMIELLELQKDAGSQQDYTCQPSGLISLLISGDLDNFMDSARSKGLLPSSEVFNVRLPKQGSSRIVFYQDPDGNRLEFIQLA